MDLHSPAVIISHISYLHGHGSHSLAGQSFKMYLACMVVLQGGTQYANYMCRLHNGHYFFYSKCTDQKFYIFLVCQDFPIKSNQRQLERQSFQ